MFEDVFALVLELEFDDVFELVFELVLEDEFEDVFELVFDDVFELEFDEELPAYFVPSSFATGAFSASRCAASAVIAPAANTAILAKVEIVMVFDMKSLHR